MLYEILNKKLVHQRVNDLKRSLTASKVFQPSNVSNFVFLCGANKSISEISERRKALIKFSTKNLPHTQFFLAVKMFSTLQKEGHKGNILDVEHLISEFSDYILIILESYSAFAELRAFSHNKLRDKLIVINDLKFKNVESFINLGPIKAIEEAKGKERIIHYNMSKDGVYRLDAIGDVYANLFDLLKHPSKPKSSSVDINSCDPSKKLDKSSAMFIHDLVYFTGPIKYKELIEILKLIFGNSNFNDVKHLLAILCSFESIERNKHGLYRSRLNKTYYEYRFDTNKIISTFRNYILKLYSDRIYGY